MHEHEGESHVDVGHPLGEGGAFNQPVGFPLAGQAARGSARLRVPRDKLDFLLTAWIPCWRRRNALHRLRCLPVRLRDVLAACAGWRMRSSTSPWIPSLAAAMFAKCAQFALISRSAPAGSHLDWLWSGDDVAGQDSMVMSPDRVARAHQAADGRDLRGRQNRGPVGGPSLLRRASSHHPRPGGDRPRRPEPCPGRLPGHGPAGAEA